MGIPLIFKVDPDGFYLYARGDKSKVCVVIVITIVRCSIHLLLECQHE